MAETLHQPGLQLRTLRLYGEFVCRKTTWAGELAMACFAGAAGTGFAAAASMAGAASLTVDANAARMKLHFRDGAFDFLVNTLDEALRALKNEVRKGKPIAIGLIAEPEQVAAEVRERGVKPAFVLTDPEDGERVQTEECCVVVLGRPPKASHELDVWLAERGLFPVEVVWATHAQGEDTLLDSVIPMGDEVRHRWLRSLPKHQRSAKSAQRWAWMSVEEEVQIHRLSLHH